MEPEFGDDLGMCVMQSMHFHEFHPGAGKNPITIAGQAWSASGYDIHQSTWESVYLPYAVALDKHLRPDS